MPHIETQSEWEARMAGKILDFVRNEICVDLRFLQPAFSVSGHSGSAEIGKDIICSAVSSASYMTVNIECRSY